MLIRLRSFALALVLAVGAIGVSACGQTACEEAADKIASCMGGSSSSAGSSSGDCSGETECLANCFNAASCDDIKGSLNLADPNIADNPVIKCGAACKK